MWMDSGTLTSHIPQSQGSRSNRPPSNNRRGDSQQANGNPRFNKNRNKPGQPRHRQQARQEGANRPQARQNAPRRPHEAEAYEPAETPHNGAVPSENAGKRVAGIEPFELFCAYHLGITRDKGYKPSNINEVARRFNADPATIKQALKEYDMDPAQLFDRDFDMALAQLDIQVAPEGVDRKELAKNIYEEFQNAPRVKRDWKKLLEEDRKENQKVFRD